MNWCHKFEIKSEESTLKKVFIKSNEIEGQMFAK
jgi:hypothetical protein